MIFLQYLFICLVSSFAEQYVNTLTAWSINTASTSITTSAYVEIEDSVTGWCPAVMASNQTSSHIHIATGGAGSETDRWVLPPKGGYAFLPTRLYTGTRVSLKALDATASSGWVVIQCLY